MQFVMAKRNCSSDIFNDLMDFQVLNGITNSLQVTVSHEVFLERLLYTTCIQCKLLVISSNCGISVSKMILVFLSFARIPS